MNLRELLGLGRPAPHAGANARERIRRRHFPDVAVRTHEGRAARFFEDLVRGRIVTINFMYAGCVGSCPLTNRNLLAVQKLLAPRVGRTIFMYSITLDPIADTPDALARFAAELGAGPGWLFLRAEPGDTERLRRSLGFWDRDPELDARRSRHITMLRYGNEPRQVWGAASTVGEPHSIARQILWAEQPSA